ncbi:alpha/beta fold hydrolase [Dyadobacter subterraneus]|uniref:Alpha/beta hydrolase n=1 Tax=Dyadobacter subterraneus TaxID=2773304 RepID=A0ABR9WDF9_9BACT|nr:alpha/beta hydrolase [Dyadobacter subterraneus]MBE9463457.1 alpha/beta hydrolase [Dyadobacter subterraneus]
MRKISTLLFLVLSISLTQGQTLYSKAFGSSKDKPVIFLHGGPGNSSVYFEATTAQKLADKGFYVIIYDRRGEGRSKDADAKMNFSEYFEDLNGLYKKYGLQKATLIGFSFGGLITAQFAEKFPEKVKSIVLVSALVSQQESYNTILRTTKAIYEKNGDKANLQDLALIEKMDKNSLEYRTACFKHASLNGYFKLKNPNQEAREMYASYETDPLIKAYIKNEQAVPTFWKNENLKNIDVSASLKNVRNKNIPIYALYGRQDGIFSEKQMSDLRNMIGNDHVKYIDNSSHTLFIDQQAVFLSSVKNWIK